MSRASAEVAGTEVTGYSAALAFPGHALSSTSAEACTMYAAAVERCCPAHAM